MTWPLSALLFLILQPCFPTELPLLRMHPPVPYTNRSRTLTPDVSVGMVCTPLLLKCIHAVCTCPSCCPAGQAAALWAVWLCQLLLVNMSEDRLEVGSQGRVQGAGRVPHRTLQGQQHDSSCQQLAESCLLLCTNNCLMRQLSSVWCKCLLNTGSDILDDGSLVVLTHVWGELGRLLC